MQKNEHTSKHMQTHTPTHTHYLDPGGPVARRGIESTLYAASQAGYVVHSESLAASVLCSPQPTSALEYLPGTPVKGLLLCFLSGLYSNHIPEL